MSDQSEALRLAEKLSSSRRWHDLTDDECDRAAAELRRQHSRIEADEALMRQATDALVNSWRELPVVEKASAITALRKRLESSK